MKSAEIGNAIAKIRREQGVTQEWLASKLNVPQSWVSKIETGERAVNLSDVFDLANAFNIPATRIVNAVLGQTSTLDEIGMSEQELSQLIRENPSLRGMILGYAAEMKFQSLYIDPLGLPSVKDDDHDRSKKGDRRVSYRGMDITIEVKSLQTNTIHQDVNGSMVARAQVDASDRRQVILSDGSKVMTTCLKVGEFDILAVCCFGFEHTWKYQFALNSKLERSNYSHYSESQRNDLIKSLQTIHSKAEDPFTEDFSAILQQAYDEKSLNLSKKPQE